MTTDATTPTDYTDAYVDALALLERIDNAAPPKQGSCVYAALVPWSLIHDVRAFVQEGKS